MKLFGKKAPKITVGDPKFLKHKKYHEKRAKGKKPLFGKGTHRR